MIGKVGSPDRRRSPHRVAQDDSRGSKQRGKAPTDRQLEILLLLLDRSERQAAADLGISVNTVKGHMQDLFARLGAYNRAHAVWLCYGQLRARQHGIDRRGGRDRRAG